VARSWSTVVKGETATRVLEAARSVSERLRNPDLVHEAAALANAQTSFPRTSPWLPYSIARGDAGMAVMCGYLNEYFPEDDWDLAAHHYLAAGVTALESRPDTAPSLFSGMAGLGAAAAYLSHGGLRYQRLLAAIDSVVARDTEHLISSVRAARGGLPVSLFDVISGLAGIGRYLLLRRDQPSVAPTLDRALNCLAELTHCDDGLPRWYTPPEFIDDSVRELFPAGTLNCGLAHGIPGPLALMAISHSCKVVPDVTGPAIKRAADWLCAHRADDAWGVNWPSMHQRDFGASPSGRCAWCYGPPGVARGLWLAGEAIGRNDYRDLAVEAMRAVFRRPVPERMIDSATFCHGISGTLQVTLRFVAETGLTDLRDGATELLTQLLALHDRDSLLGYRNLERPGIFTDQPGLLDGAAGVVMTLLSAATDVEPAWDSIFLLN